MEQPQEQQEPVPTIYDNDLSMMYKWAIFYSIPVKYLVITHEDIPYKSIFDIVNQKLELGIYEIYQYLQPILKDILDTPILKNLPYIYYHVLKETQQPIFPQIQQQIINEIVAYYRQIKVSTTISNILTMEHSYNIWLQDFTKQFQIDQQYNNIEIQFQNTLESISPLPQSMFIIESVLKEVSFSYQGHTPEINDGIEIFNQSSVSPLVPYIQYNGNIGEDYAEKFFKIYNGPTRWIQDYGLIVPSFANTITPNSIYVTVINSNLNISRPIKEDYSYGVYDLTNNAMKIEISIIEGVEDTSLSRIKQVIPLQETSSKDININGNFNIYQVDFVEVSFLHMIMTNELMSYYIFLNETRTRVSEKKKLKFKLRSPLESVSLKREKFQPIYKIPSSLTFTITQKYTTPEKSVQVLGDNGEMVPVIFPANTPYINVNIIDGKSEQDIIRFMAIFSRISSLYINQSQEIINMYRDFLDVGISRPIVSSPRNMGSNILMLKNAIPELFVPKYARSCQTDRQPKLIMPEEAQEWIDRTFMYRGQELKRQILKFPFDTEKWMFVCPNDKYPFPGVQENKTESRNLYNVFPCCFATDQMGNANRKNAYNKYIQHKIEEGRPKGFNYKIKGDKIVPTGRTGFLPTPISDLIGSVPNLLSAETISLVLRLGVPKSPNSLLHCVLVAMDDTNYLSLRDNEKEEYVQRVKVMIANNTNPALLKQELYDVQIEHIIDTLKAPQIFLDAQLYYRAIEEYYKINLYVFTIEDPHGVPTTAGFPPPDGVSILQIPRHKLIHVSLDRTDRDSIVVFQNWGTAVDKLLYPQYELVTVGHDNEINMVKFPPQVSSLLYNVTKTLYSVYTWDIHGQMVNTNINRYLTINYEEVLTDSIGQIIDDYGKMRGLVMDLGNGHNFTVIIPPSQPNNLPIMDITYNNIEDIMEVFSENPPLGLSKHDNEITGIWFPYIEEGKYDLFLPIKPIKPELLPEIYKNLPEGPPNPYITYGSNTISTIHIMRKNINILLQVIWWLYNISGVSLNQFIDSYMTYPPNEMNIDSGTYYHLDNFPRTFPIVSNIQQGLIKINQYSNTLIQDNKIFMYSKKLYNGVIYFLQSTDKIVEGLNKVIPKEIANYYMSETDFLFHNNELIFIKESHFRLWLSEVSQTRFNNIRIYDRINLSYKSQTEPYLFKDDQTIYIIQNVLLGDIKRAINVALTWNQQKINLGFHADPYINPQVPLYNVYGISVDNLLVPISIQPQPTDIQLLSYGNNQYGTMIQLYIQS